MREKLLDPLERGVNIEGKVFDRLPDTRAAVFGRECRSLLWSSTSDDVREAIAILDDLLAIAKAHHDYC